MNEKDTLVEMTGNIVKEAWENGRKEAWEELADRETYIETLRDENRKMLLEIEELESLLKRIKDIANGASL